MRSSSVQNVFIETVVAVSPWLCFLLWSHSDLSEGEKYAQQRSREESLIVKIEIHGKHAKLSFCDLYKKNGALSFWDAKFINIEPSRSGYSSQY